MTHAVGGPDPKELPALGIPEPVPEDAAGCADSKLGFPTLLPEEGRHMFTTAVGTATAAAMVTPTRIKADRGVWSSSRPSSCVVYTQH